MTTNGSVGPVEVTAGPSGLVRIRLGAARNAARGEGADARAVAEAGLKQILEYLRGERTRFDLPLDLSRATPFRRRVLEALRGVPFGSTVTYGGLSEQIGAGSARAVGQAVGRNPLPIVIPCHRVLQARRGLGGFSAGLYRKIALLRLEGVAPGAGWDPGGRPSAGR